MAVSRVMTFLWAAVVLLALAEAQPSKHYTRGLASRYVTRQLESNINTASSSSAKGSKASKGSRTSSNSNEEHEDRHNIYDDRTANSPQETSTSAAANTTTTTTTTTTAVVMESTTSKVTTTAAEPAIPAASATTIAVAQQSQEEDEIVTTIVDSIMHVKETNKCVPGQSTTKQVPLHFILVLHVTTIFDVILPRMAADMEVILEEALLSLYPNTENVHLDAAVDATSATARSADDTTTVRFSGAVTFCPAPVPSNLSTHLEQILQYVVGTDVQNTAVANASWIDSDKETSQGPGVDFFNNGGGSRSVSTPADEKRGWIAAVVVGGLALAVGVGVWVTSRRKAANPFHQSWPSISDEMSR